MITRTSAIRTICRFPQEFELRVLLYGNERVRLRRGSGLSCVHSGENHARLWREEHFRLSLFQLVIEVAQTIAKRKRQIIRLFWAKIICSLRFENGIIYIPLS